MQQLRSVRRVVTGAALSVVLASMAVPADAGSNQAAVGTLAFEGGADLSAGTWAGTFTGTLSGRYVETDGQEIPWSVTMMNPATASLTSVDVLGCAAGTVQGRFRTKSNGTNQAFGAWVNSIVPSAIVAVDATFDVEWRRAGTAGTMVFTGAVVDVQLNYAGRWVRVVDTSDSDVGASSARLEADDPTTCRTGVLKGELADLALRTG